METKFVPTEISRNGNHLNRYLKRRIDLSWREKLYSGLMDLAFVEQYMNAC